MTRTSVRCRVTHPYHRRSMLGHPSSGLDSRVRTFWSRLRSAYAKHQFARRVRRARGGVLRIVVGAGGVPVKGWIESEASFLDLREPDTWNRYFQSNSIDAILAEHVWEHLRRSDGLVAARTCFRYLKPGGYLRIAVPDGHHPDSAYIEAVRVGGTGCGADDHRALYTAETLVDLLREAGFVPELLEYFDNLGVFHEAPWSPQAGPIQRSRRFDTRNRDRPLSYTSLIVDAHKPM
jgi:predicted SAM-dependent methyltransferase